MWPRIRHPRGKIWGCLIKAARSGAEKRRERTGRLQSWVRQKPPRTSQKKSYRPAAHQQSLSAKPKDRQDERRRDRRRGRRRTLTFAPGSGHDGPQVKDLQNVIEKRDTRRPATRAQEGAVDEEVSDNPRSLRLRAPCPMTDNPGEKEGRTLTFAETRGRSPEKYPRQ